MFDKYILWAFLGIIDYPPVGSEATEGVLSEGYMNVCPDQVLHQNHVRHSTFPIKNMAEKHGGNFRAFYTASDDRNIGVLYHLVFSHF